MSHLGQGKTARAVGVPSGVEAASLLAGKERSHWDLPSLSSCCCFSPAFPFPQTSRELFKASGAGGTKWSKEKKGILVSLACSGSSKNLQGKEYSPVENSFQCVCEIGRMAAPGGALFHGASTSLCASLCNLQHNPLLQSPLTQVLVLGLSLLGVRNSMVALSMLLCTLGQKVTSSGTGCKLQSTLTVRVCYKKVSSECSGENRLWVRYSLSVQDSFPQV